MLTTLEAVLSKDEVREMRAVLQQATWHDGANTAGSLARSVKRNQQLDDRDPQAQALGERILARLGATPRFISAALPRRIYPPKFNRYAGGGTYGAHVDAAVMLLPGGRERLRSDVSATLFLTEPEDYDGGELEIETPFGVQAVKLEAGDLVLYPSTSLHRVTPVTRGERLAAFFWTESLVADEGERALLFDLDQTIQGLQSAQPAQPGQATLPADDDRLLSLTGVYHNLLRRWAST